MAWIKTLLVPNRYDSLYLLIGVICFLAAVSPFAANHEYFPPLGPAACAVFLIVIGICFLAMGAVVGLRKHSWRRVGWMYLVGAALPLAAVLAYYFLKQNQTVLNCVMPFPAFFVSSLPPSQLDLGQLGLFYGAMLLLPFASWLLFSFIQFGPTIIKTFFATRLNISRSKVLIAIAGIMLLLGILNNILRSTSSSYEQALPKFILGTIATLVTIGVSVVVIYFPTRLMASSLAAWIKRIAFIAMIGLLSLGLWFFFLRNLPNPILRQAELMGVISTVALVIVYLLGVVSVADPKRIQRADETEPNVEPSVEPAVSVSDLPMPPISMVQRFPSVWSIGILLFLGGLYILPFRYDMVTLASGQGLATARRESALRWSSRGQIMRSLNQGGNLYCDFDETTRPDVLTLLDGDPATEFVFSGRAPQVDFSCLDRNLFISTAVFERGQITSKQLDDLLSRPVTCIRIGDCQVIDTGQRITPASIVELALVSPGDANPELEKILSLFESFENVDSVSIQMDVPVKAWPQLVRASEHALVSVVFGQIPHDLSIEQIKSTKENFLFPYNGIRCTQTSLTSEQIGWLENSGVKFQLFWQLNESQPQILYDMMFAYPHRFDVNLPPMAPSIASFTHDLDLKDSSLASHFIFERDDKGNPTALYLPCGEFNIAIEDLTELRILSFDEGWLQERFITFERGLVDLSYLTKLEQLSFSPSSSLGSIGFLASLKSLKDLQMPAVSRSSMVGPGFDSCPSLETITMFGKPDAKSINEFQRLPNLKKLTIVDLYDTLAYNNTISAGVKSASPDVKNELLETLKTQLPEVKVTIVGDKEFSRNIPDSFHEHLASLRKQLRKKLRAESDKANER